MEGNDLKRRNHELSVLNVVARELNRPVNLSDALEFALSRVAELLGLSTGWIWLTSPSDPDDTYLAAARNLPPVLRDNPSLLDGSSYCYCLDTFKKGDLDGAANVNVVSCSRLKRLPEGTGGLKYHASIPLYSGPQNDDRLGVMNVAAPDWRSLSPDDLRLLYTIGDLLGLAIERARLFADRERLGASEERNRLAREIHDTLAQGLSATVLQLETAESLLEDPALGKDRATRPVKRALELTRDNLDEARRSVLDLRAAPLEGRTLAQAIRTLAERWETEQNDTSVRFSAVNGARSLPPNIESAVYRIAQESLTNIARHAHAQRVSVGVVITPHLVTLKVEDDGHGIPDTPTPSEGRHGLIGMRERAEFLGGTFDFHSSPDEGTTIEVGIPLEDE